MKKSRRKAREFALRAFYQWQVTKTPPTEFDAQLHDPEDFARADTDYYQVLIEGVARHVEALNAALGPHLTLPLHGVSPVERGALWVGAFELLHRPDVPYRVVINEAVELAKQYGGADGHKFVNGVLDKLAAGARRDEIAYERRPAGADAAQP